MEYQAITLKKQDGIATITLNRPEKLNSVNYQLIYDFQMALDELDRDDEETYPRHGKWVCHRLWV